MAILTLDGLEDGKGVIDSIPKAVFIYRLTFVIYFRHPVDEFCNDTSHALIIGCNTQELIHLVESMFPFTPTVIFGPQV